jgi:integrase
MGRDGRGVTKVSESSIQISFTYRGVVCRERLQLKPTRANLKEAERIRAEILLHIARGVFNYAKRFPDSPRAHTFAEYQGDTQSVTDYLEAWLKQQKQRLKASTVEGYRVIVEYLVIPRFGKLTLTELTRRAFRDWFDTMTCGNKRLANVQSVIRTALEDAKQDGLIESNPLYGYTYKKKEPPKEDDDVDPFDTEEREAIIAGAPDQAGNMFEFAFWSGLRTSELIALEWNDVDWRKGVVMVRRAKTKTSAEPEDTKTKAGRRAVKLLPSALAALEAQKPYTLLANKQIWHDPRYNKPWADSQAIRTVWVRTLRLAKVRYRKPYQTRHTYASMMLSAGEHPMWVAKQIGHASADFTMRVYDRWIPSADPDAGGKAVARFAAKRLRLSCDSEPKIAK